jgi:KUP system potassium uptake protein
VAKPFYNAVPRELQWPVVVLATFATIVASQAMITGLFSVLTQAYALKFLPRIEVLHTNPDEQGQVYIPEANWALCTMCIAICVAFRSSSRLAGAYGIAVTSTFLVTTCLLWLVLRHVWRWPLLLSLMVIVPLLLIDMALWSANVLKIIDSGWVPVVISAFLCLLMHTHHWGRTLEESVMADEAEAEARELQTSGVVTKLVTLPALQSALRAPGLVTRTDKVAVFLTPHAWRVPRTVGALATRLGCLPRTIVLLSVRLEHVPFVSEEHRASLKVRGEGIFSVVLRFGYAEPLTAERFAIHRVLAGLARGSAKAHPELVPLAALDRQEDEREKETCGQEERSIEETFAAEEGRSVAAAASMPQGQHGPIFVLNKVHYESMPDVGHGLWDRFRIALYSFVVLNARKPIRFFGLEGGNTMEISGVRFL